MFHCCDLAFRLLTPHSCAYQAGPTQPLPVANSEFDGKDAYVPGDALLPHPHKPGYWRVLGRVDDQIMLSTGEIVCALEDVRDGALMICARSIHHR